MKRLCLWVACALGIVALSLIAALFVYGRYYGIPKGPALPENPAGQAVSEKAIALNNKAAELQFRDPNAALRLYDEAIRVDPTYHMAHANKGQLLVQQKKYEKAVRCYERLALLRPRAAEYYAGHAFCLQRLGRPKEAQKRLLYALSAYNYRIQGDPFHARLNRAMVLFLLGRQRVSRRELESLREQHPDTASQQMVDILQRALDEAEKADPWSALGLDG